jgi:hypothetical protein
MVSSSPFVGGRDKFGERTKNPLKNAEFFLKARIDRLCRRV